MARNKRTADSTTDAVLDAAFDAAETTPVVLTDSVQTGELPAVLTVPVTTAKPTPAPLTTVWRVPQTVRVSVFGHITTLPAGSLVKLSDYGDDGIRRLLDQVPDLIPVS